MFYFAFIDETNLCTGVYAMPSDLSNLPGYIAITEEQYTSQSVVGKYYDAETNTWVDPPAFACNTDEVQYKETGTTLSAKLDDMDEAIEGAVNAAGAASTAASAASTAAATAAASAHTHDNKSVLDGITAEKVAAWDNGTGGGSGTATSMTADEILTKVKTVDGANSGLDADLLDGHNSDYFATAEQLNGKANAEHSHTGFAAEGHTHDGFATADHTHEGYASANDLAGKADANHTHEGYATADHSHTGYAAEGHTHTGYATTSDLAGKADANHSHNDYINATTYANGMNGKADVSHSHSEYAPSNHSHNGYASSNHSHSDYLPTSGGTVGGNLNVNGILRVNGQQSVFDSGTMITLSTNNRETMIAGSKIYSKTTISVSSDRRLKENIKEVSADDMTKFINGLDIKSFNYIGNDEPCIGVIAQEVTEADPELAKYFVRQDEKGYYSVKAADLVFPLIAAVQKLAAEVEELKNR